MDYKKLYEETIEKVKGLIEKRRNGGLYVIPIKDIEDSIPELKESEDEKIRNRIIDLVNARANCNDVEPMIAWLEKHSTPQVRTGLEWVNTIDDACDKRYLEEYAHGEYCHEQSFKWGFQEGVDWLEKQGEQKSNDNIEPKFHEGDWIITNKKYIWYVDKTPETTSYLYRLINQYGKVEVAEFEVVDEKARLWSIEDAKDGDVLYDGNAACIFRKTMEDDDAIWIDTYCGINIDNEFKVNDEDECWCISSECSPATKEQRDTLYKTMHEAGYEWDAEKLQLKKIKQKPDYCHHEVDLSDCSEDYTKGYYDGWNNCNQQHSQLKTEQKPWSEEEVEIIDWLVASFDCLKIPTDTFYQSKVRPFLISLRNKIQPIINEWSEEDEELLESWYDKLISMSVTYQSMGHGENATYLRRIANWLKSIKYKVQPKQEWSEEDERNLNDAILFIETGTYSLDKDNLINWLKSLRPQKRWKPSDWQMEALLYEVNAWDEDSVNGQNLKSLYNDLKKL